MYSYYDLASTRSTIFEAESLTTPPPHPDLLFDLNKYTSADINGALLLRPNEYLFRMKNPGGGSGGRGRYFIGTCFFI